MSLPSPVTLHLFASIKGGVGKSTLAWVAAHLLAQQGRTPVVVDLDFTGSSLADGLKLRAPQLESLGQPPHVLHLDREPTGLLSLQQTIERRLLRKNARGRNRRGATHLPYLNDFMTWAIGDTPSSLRSLMWRREEAGIPVLPSSPLVDDLTQAALWVALPQNMEDWLERVQLLLSLLAAEKASDIILDVPPGLHSFGLAALDLIASMEGMLIGHEGDERRWATRAWLVCNGDRNVFIQAVEAYAQLAARRSDSSVGRLGLILNQDREGVPAAWTRCADVLDKQFPGGGIASTVRRGPHLDVLAAVFRGRTLDYTTLQTFEFLTGG